MILFTLPLIVLLSAGNIYAEPHSDVAETGCLDCHMGLPFKDAPNRFHDSSDEVCIRCHRISETAVSHPVGVKPGHKLPVDMPLNSRGEIMCITCHTYHTSILIPSLKKKAFLRRTVADRMFCISCHKTDPLQRGDRERSRGLLTGSSPYQSLNLSQSTLLVHLILFYDTN